MADEKPQLTEHLNLGPGVVVTPGHEVRQSTPRRVASDRRLNADGTVMDHDGEFGSTYGESKKDEQSGMAEGEKLSRTAPDRK